MITKMLEFTFAGALIASVGIGVIGACWFFAELIWKFLPVSRRRQESESQSKGEAAQVKRIALDLLIARERERRNAKSVKAASVQMEAAQVADGGYMSVGPEVANIEVAPEHKSEPAPLWFLARYPNGLQRAPRLLSAYHLDHESKKVRVAFSAGTSRAKKFTSASAFKLAPTLQDVVPIPANASARKQNLNLPAPAVDYEESFGLADINIVRDPEAGQAVLIELLIAAMVLLVLAAVAVPNVVTMHASVNQGIAYHRVLQVAQAEAAQAICAENPPAGGCPTLPMIPVVGSVVQSGYWYSFSGGTNWTYTATPMAQGISGNQSYYTSSDGLMRCGTSKSDPPC